MAVAEPYVHQPARRGLARVQEWRQTVERVSLIDRIAMAAFLGVILIALAAPLLAPHNPIQPAGIPFLSPGHGGFLFGTDEVGQDMLSRILFGLRSSLVAAGVVIATGVLVGGAIGLIAGAAGGWLEDLLMRITDIFLALPGPLLAIAVVAALGPSFSHTLIAVSIVWWPFYARIGRAEVKAQAVRPHLEAARMAGVGKFRRAGRHLLPGAVPAIIVTASLDVGNLIVTLAALSFLGLGAPAPAPELGAMAARGLQYLLQEWWVPVIPALVVFVVAMLANLAGDGLRDMLGDR
jgi:peptide/nickel transport system permease protein